jgi:hypothetical protein
MNYEYYRRQATVIVNFFSLKQETILVLSIGGVLYTYLIVVVMRFKYG